MMTLEAVNNGFSGIRAQDYKWANVVIDKEMEDVVMDWKKLSNHPKYTETWTRVESNKYSRFQGYRTMEYGKK